MSMPQTLAQARDALRNGDITATELTQQCLKAIDENAHLNAFITLTPERALADAAAADAALAKKQFGLLTGVPIGMKDLFCTKGIRTTAASRMLDNFVPTYESHVSQLLADAGSVLLGKLNLDEFAMGSSNRTSYYGAAVNPLQPERRLTAGGSSGGSAAAVAANLCYGATGTDTGGSIRQPASFTGIVGIKPTYGRCSRYGVVAFASSLDQPGPMTRTVQDAAIMLQAMAGYDARDSTSVNVPVPNYEAALTQDVRGLRVGLVREYDSEHLSPQVAAVRDKAVAMLKARGAQIVDVSLPHTQYALPAYYVIAPAEASSNLARYDGVRYGLRVADPTDDIHTMYAKTRAAGFGAEVQRRILIGTYVLSSGYYDAFYVKAQKIRALMQQDFTQAFTQADVLLTPATPSAAFGLDDATVVSASSTQMYLNDVFTVPANLVGLPALSVPAGVDATGLPLGIQLIGRAFSEEQLLRTAQVIESDCAA